MVDGGRVSVCSDTRDGVNEALQTPFCTIGAALEAAPGGSTVLVRKGTYRHVSLSGLRWSEPVTLRGAAGERPVVDGVDMADVSGLVVQGFKLTRGIEARRIEQVGFFDNEVVLDYRGARTGSGFVLVSANRVAVQGNRVTGGRDGVNLVTSTPVTSHVAVVGNHLQRLGGDGIHYNAGQHDLFIARNVIEDVRVRDDVDGAVHSDALQGIGPVEDVQVVSNFVRGGRGFLFAITTKQADDPVASEDLLVANNVLAGPDFGIRLYSTRRARVVNNTVWGTSSGPNKGLDVHDRAYRGTAPTTGMVLVNNVVKRLDVDDGVGFARRDHNLIADGPRSGPHDMAGVPEFAGPKSFDLRLKPDSAGIDAGDAGVAPVVDALGRARIGAPDLGADEVGGRVVAPPAVAAPSPAPAPAEGPPVLDEFLASPGVVTDRSTPTPTIHLGPGTVGGPGALTLAWRTATPGLAYIRVDRRFTGRRKRGTCVARRSAPRRARSCRGAAFAGWVVRPAVDGMTTTALTRRLGDTVLRRGLHEATLVLLGPDGRVSAPRTVQFLVR